MANYPIIDVEGIGAATAEKLKAVGIDSTNEYAAATNTAKERKELAEKTGISEKLILDYANMIDLFRVAGVGPQYAEMLKAAGVDTVPELAQRNAANLTVALKTANDTKNIANRTPSETEVTKWVDTAKQLPRVIEY